MGEVDMPEFGLVEPFDIDNGELDGIAPGECFCLGIEFAMFRQRIQSGQVFTELVLANNAARICAMAERHGRFNEWRPSETAGWATVTVGSPR